MKYQIFGAKENPTLLLIPGLGVSYEIFLPLIEILKNKYYIIATELDGFTLGEYSKFTSVDDQAVQIIKYITENLNGKLDCAYGLSLGGKILSRILERDEISIQHSILDAAPLIALPKWLVNPLRYLQSYNVWTCYHWTNFWKFIFPSHYFKVILDECKKVFPYGGRESVLDGYKSVYTNTLESISNSDIHYWYGTLEAFVAKPQVKHLLKLHPNAQIVVFPKKNHGQLLTDAPEEIASRILKISHQ